MKRLIFAKLVFVICIFSIVFALASEANADTIYFEFKPGAYFPQKGVMKDADTGIGTEMAVGYYFHPNFAAELGIGAYYTRVPVTVTVGPLSDRFKANLWLYPVTLDLVASNKIGIFEPYVKAGIGEYFVYRESALFEPSETKSAFGYQFGLGAVFLNFGIEGKYLFAEPTILDTKVKLDGFTVNVFYKMRF
jgi:hypothetical protein